jgi:hypothetical protein
MLLIPSVIARSTADSTLCFVNCHLNSHHANVRRRNQDYRDICDRLRFPMLPTELSLWDHEHVRQGRSGGENNVFVGQNSALCRGCSGKQAGDQFSRSVSILWRRARCARVSVRVIGALIWTERTCGDLLGNWIGGVQHDK